MSHPRRYAILGDVHGNLEALTAVLADAREQACGQFACVGDLVGYNANPMECIAIVRELGCTSVRGNHDHYVSHQECVRDFSPLAANVVDWTRKQLSAEDSAYLRTLRMTVSMDGFTLVHSTLDMPEKWGYVFDEFEAEANFNYQSTPVCFHGHTHQPVVFEKTSVVRRCTEMALKLQLGRKYFINVGSVGQPRDGDPRAAYAIFDAEKREVEIRRVPYDYVTTQRKILDAGLPGRLAMRLAVGM